jgi:putative sterol carrier protein
MTKGAVAGLKADITIDVADSDFVSLGEGTANGQKLFMAGKIKVKGAVMMATKLDAVINSAKKNDTKAKL